MNYIFAFMNSVNNSPTGLYLKEDKEFSEDEIYKWMDIIIKEFHPIENAVAAVETPLSKQDYWDQEDNIIAGLIGTLFDFDLNGNI